jgi:hypothetical protein
MYSEQFVISALCHQAAHVLMQIFTDPAARFLQSLGMTRYDAASYICHRVVKQEEREKQTTPTSDTTSGSIDDNPYAGERIPARDLERREPGRAVTDGCISSAREAYYRPRIQTLGALLSNFARSTVSIDLVFAQKSCLPI